MAIEVEAAPPARRSIRFNFRRDLVFFGVVAIILVVDQALKWYITGNFSRGEYWPSRDWPVRITYVENAGAAFGILQNQGIFLIASTMIGLGAIIAYYLYPPFEHGILRLAMALMLGGAIGNLIDRVRQGYVVDFINTSFWPTFNVADSCITVGMAILVTFLVLADRKRDKPAPSAAESGEPRRRMTPRTFVVEEPGERLDRFLVSACPDLSRSAVQRLIDEGAVTVDGAPARSSLRVATGSRVSMVEPPSREVALAAEAMALDVVYEDGAIVVVNKPAGLSVHPGPGHPDGTLVNGLLAHIPDLGGIGGELRPGIVHRLDKDTSGLLVVAKTAQAHTALVAAFGAREVSKTYLAIVRGTPEPREGVIEGAIARDPRQRQRMALVEGGRAARTAFRVLAEGGGWALVEVRPETGRTHQIRVHMASIGHPVAGDGLYGRREEGVGRQMLHAWRLRFAHPVSGDEVALEAPPPEDFRDALARMGLDGGW